MKHSMKHVIALGLVVATGAVAASAVAAEQSYTDASGDSGTAPDLTAVAVTDSNGFVAFKVSVTLVPSSTLVIFIDADRNRSTGDEGDELMVGVENESETKSYWFASRWNGTKWERAGFDVTSQTYPGREELGFRAADAGLTGGFDFAVGTFKMVADAVEGRDYAPDSVVPWGYELTSRAVTTTTTTAVLGKVWLTPLRPAAGSRLTVRVPVTSSDAKQPLTTRVVKCSARVKGRTVRGTASVAAGLATCKLGIPNGSSGSLGRGSITVGTGAQAVSKTFSFRIA
jgi:hypothetical protein